jgi:hypothetical protein
MSNETILDELKSTESAESIARQNSTAAHNAAHDWVLNKTKEFVEEVGPVFDELRSRTGSSLGNQIKELVRKMVE